MGHPLWHAHQAKEYEPSAESTTQHSPGRKPQEKQRHDQALEGMRIKLKRKISSAESAI